jgi:arylsulfatase A-like enzyme
VPFALQWKGELSPGSFDYPVSSMDIFATIAAVSNAPLNEDKPLDGVNLIPFLKSEKEGKPHDILFLRKFDNDRFAVRKGDYKLITMNGNSVKELYNLETDISETINLSEKFPDKLRELDSLRAKWNKELIDPVFLGLIHTDEWKNRAKN